MKPTVRTAQVALTAPALAHQWARQEDGPHGAAVIAEREISARSRGGVEWTQRHALAVSMIARPADMAVSGSELGWLAAGLAAADILDWIEGQEEPAPRLHWPDEVDGRSAGVAAVAISSDAILGPGRVAYLVVTVRIGFTEMPDGKTFSRLVDRTVADLRRWCDGLDDQVLLVNEYRNRCITLRRPVTVHRSPHGSIRGVAYDISPGGGLILRSPTGLDEVIAVAAVRRVESLEGLPGEGLAGPGDGRGVSR